MRSLSVIDIDSASATGLGTILLNRNGTHLPSFALFSMLLVITISIDNANASPVNIDPEHFGQQATLRVRYKHNNQPIYNDIPLGALDLWVQSVHKGVQVITYDRLAAQSVSGSASNEAHTFALELPFFMPRAARPEDFVPRLSLIDDVRLTFPAGCLDAAGDLSIGSDGISVSLKGNGRECREGDYAVPTAFCVEQFSGKPGNDVRLVPTADRFHSLWELTIDSGGSPISGETGPRVSLDGTQRWDYTNLNAAQLPAVLADPGFGAPADTFANLTTNVTTGPLAPFTTGTKTADCPEVDEVAIRYQSRMTTPADARFILTSIYNTSPAQVAKAMPKRMTSAEVASRVSIPGASGNVGALAAALPRKVSPEA